MENPKYKELNIKVSSRTADYLEKTSKASRLPMGTIVDRALLTWMGSDPAAVAERIADDMIIHTRRLSEAEILETFTLVLQHMEHMLTEGAFAVLHPKAADVSELLERIKNSTQ